MSLFVLNKQTFKVFFNVYSMDISVVMRMLRFMNAYFQLLNISSYRQNAKGSELLNECLRGSWQVLDCGIVRHTLRHLQLMRIFSI